MDTCYLMFLRVKFIETMNIELSATFDLSEISDLIFSSALLISF